MTSTSLDVHDLSKLKPEKFKGSIAAYYPEHPRALDNSGMVYWAVLVMENDLGRYLNRGENVSHIDRDKTNNAISNLGLGTPSLSTGFTRKRQSTCKCGKPMISRGKYFRSFCSHACYLKYRPKQCISKLEHLSKESLVDIVSKSSMPCAAQSLGVNETTLRNRCRKLGITIHNDARKTQVVWPEKDALTKLVWESTLRDIAKSLKTSHVTLRKYCKNNGISVPKAGYWQKVKIQWPEKTMLTEMLQESSPSRVAKSLGIATNTLKSYCRSSNILIPMHTRSIMRRQGGHWPARDKLIEMVWQMPLSAAAANIGVGEHTLKNRCARLSIPVPSASCWSGPPIWPEAGTMKSMLLTNGLTQIAKLLNVNKSDLKKYYVKLGIPVPIGTWWNASIDWPDKETLQKMVLSIPAKKLGTQLGGVCSQVIRRYCDSVGIMVPKNAGYPRSKTRRKGNK